MSSYKLCSVWIVHGICPPLVVIAYPCPKAKELESDPNYYIDFAQKKHRAGFAVQQQGVLAAPALPVARGQFGFKHRSGIGEDAVAELLDLRGDFFTQRLQAAAHHLVVVTPPRIDRHNALKGDVAGD